MHGLSKLASMVLLSTSVCYSWLQELHIDVRERALPTSLA